MRRLARSVPHSPRASEGRGARREALGEAARGRARAAASSAGYYYYSTGTVEVYTAAVVESGFVRECVPSFLHADSYFKKG